VINDQPRPTCGKNDANKESMEEEFNENMEIMKAKIQAAFRAKAFKKP
jgi:hypothetical protein